MHPNLNVLCPSPHSGSPNVLRSFACSKASGPFSSWVKNAAGRLGRGPFSRTAKKKDEVDDLLNSDAFLNKKVEILRKQIAVTQGEINDAQLEAKAEWEEWGPQVSDRKTTEESVSVKCCRGLSCVVLTCLGLYCLALTCLVLSLVVRVLSRVLDVCHVLSQSTFCIFFLSRMVAQSVAIQSTAEDAARRIPGVFRIKSLC